MRACDALPGCGRKKLAKPGDLRAADVGPISVVFLDLPLTPPVRHPGGLRAALGVVYGGCVSPPQE